MAAPELAYHRRIDLAPLGTAVADAVVATSGEKPLDAAKIGGPVRIETRYLVSEQPTDASKRFPTLRAHLALKGYCLHRTAAGDGPVYFYVTRWGMARELRDLEAVARFLKQVGGIHA
jgi:hypothetical protein